MIIGRQHTHGTAFHGAHAAMFELLLQRDVEVEQLLSSSVANAREQDVRSDQRLRYATYVEEKKSRLGVVRFHRLSFENQIVDLFIRVFGQTLRFAPRNWYR